VPQGRPLGRVISAEVRTFQVSPRKKGAPADFVFQRRFTARRGNHLFPGPFSQATPGYGPRHGGGGVERPASIREGTDKSHASFSSHPLSNRHRAWKLPCNPAPARTNLAFQSPLGGRRRAKSCAPGRSVFDSGPMEIFWLPGSAGGPGRTGAKFGGVTPPAKLGPIPSSPPPGTPPGQRSEKPCILALPRRKSPAMKPPCNGCPGHPRFLMARPRLGSRLGPALARVSGNGFWDTADLKVLGGNSARPGRSYLFSVGRRRQAGLVRGDPGRRPPDLCLTNRGAQFVAGKRGHLPARPETKRHAPPSARPAAVE